MEPPLKFIKLPLWMRKLIGKLGLSYSRRLRVRGSAHPPVYDADLSLLAADSNAFRIHWLLPCPERLTASWTVLDSSGAKRAPIRERAGGKHRKSLGRLLNCCEFMTALLPGAR